MRQVVLYQLLSLDGVAEEPGDWLFDVDDELVENLRAVISRQDDVLLGRGTYEYWVNHWPNSDYEPFASFINGTTKHVFTSSALTREWANTTVVTGPAVEYVAALKSRPGRDIGIHGSITLARNLLAADLVDELRLVVAPTLAGRGDRLFTNPGLRRWELLEARPTSMGATLLGYRRMALGRLRSAAGGP